MLALVSMVYSGTEMPEQTRSGVHQPEWSGSGELGLAAPRGGAVMTGPQVLVLQAQALSTHGLQGWIQDNVIPLVLLGIAIILLWIGGKGDNAGVARRSVGLIVGLVALGIAVSGNGPEIGNFLAGLLIG
jgi:hypothetical protein